MNKLRKTRVLWLQNIIIPRLCDQLGVEKTYVGGWITALFDELHMDDNFELAIVAPIPSTCAPIEGKAVCGSFFYGFYEKRICNYDKDIETKFRQIIEDFKPDVVHIFGTEFPHTLAMVRAFHKPERTVIHIQGLISVCARHYYASLPNSVVRGWTIRDLIRHDNIMCQKKKFELRGKYEIEALKQVGHVMGRTDWDKACVKWINPKTQYHEVQEIMRSEFYDGGWQADKCEKYSIFMSQGSYPIKGLHFALEAIYILKTKYPQAKLYIAGTDSMRSKDIKQKLKQTYYTKYIRFLIEKWDLEDHVIFMGSLNEIEMKERYLSSHVFVSASVIENSPNSIGEAMLLGVPVVASDVGGVATLISHRENGFLYQADAPYMLAYYVDHIFENTSLASRISENEKKRAEIVYSRKKILKRIVQIYDSMTSA